MEQLEAILFPGIPLGCKSQIQLLEAFAQENRARDQTAGAPVVQAQLHETDPNFTSSRKGGKEAACVTLHMLNETVQEMK